ncbi:MAG: hypothetical protein ACRCTE_08335, partial [Cellulosilyticaceae bacterium]
MSSSSELLQLAERLLDHTDLLHLECSCLLPYRECTGETLILLPLQKDVPFDSSFCIPQLFSLLSALYYLNISFGYLFEIGPSS